MYATYVDLQKTPCPEGFVVEIEGESPVAMPTRCVNLLAGIGYAFGGKGFFADQCFLNRITVVKFNVGKLIKVRIAPQQIDNQHVFSKGEIL